MLNHKLTGARLNKKVGELALSKRLTKPEVMLILDRDSLTESGLYELGDGGIKLSSEYRYQDVTVAQESLILAEAELDARLDFPCTPEQLIGWYERIGRSIPIHPNFLTKFNSVSGSLNSRRDELVPLNFQRTAVLGLVVAQEKAQKINLQRKNDANLKWRDKVKRLLTMIPETDSVMHACMMIEGYDEKAAKQLKSRYYRELRSGMIEKPRKLSP